MHEMGIANSILEAVSKENRLYPGYRVVKVGLRIGPYAGVDPESLRFCFGAIVKETPQSSLELDIEAGPGDELDFSSMELEEVHQ